jgi:hypothetical protein
VAAQQFGATLFLYEQYKIFRAPSIERPLLAGWETTNLGSFLFFM